MTNGILESGTQAQLSIATYKMNKIIRNNTVNL